MDPHIDPQLPQFSVLGVHIHNVGRLRAIGLIEEVVRRRDGRPKSVFFVNAHTLNLAAADPSYRQVLAGLDAQRNIRHRRKPAAIIHAPYVLQRKNGLAHGVVPISARQCEPTTCLTDASLTS